MQPQVRKNLLSLGSIQVLNLVFPLIALPLLLNRVGIEKLGLIYLSQTIMNILIVFVDYGLNLHGTREIGRVNGDKQTMEALNVGIYKTKMIQLVVAFILLLILIEIIPGWSDERFLFLTSFTLVIGQAFMPTWYFQGVEKMSQISLLNFLSRLIYLLGIYLFINSNTYKYVNLINGTAWILLTFPSGLILLKGSGLRKLLSSSISVTSILKENFQVFLATLASSGHRNSPMIIGSIFLDEFLLGLYGILDKVILLMGNSFVIIFRVFLPRASRMKSLTNPSILRIRITKSLQYAIPITIVAMIVAVFIAPGILSKFEKLNFITSVHAIPIFLMPLLFTLNLPISLFLLTNRLNKEFLQYNSTGFLGMLVWGISLGFNFNLVGLLYGLVLAEISLLFKGWVIVSRQSDDNPV